jgi:ATP-dependent helicase/nuclease subunit A
MTEQLNLGFDDWTLPNPTQERTEVPPDEDERVRIREALGSTLFVEAGAGAGKTSSLVARIVNLVEADIPITGLAAITFTEKAAAELRSKIRTALGNSDSQKSSVALEHLDHAPIGTLHSFARRILFEYPIESGLPPGFSVLDELESGLAFEEQWDDLLDRLLDDPDPPDGMIEGGRAFVELCEFDRFGINGGLRRMADDFRANWDLVDERVSLDDPGPLNVDTTGLLERARAIAEFLVPEDDKQSVTVAQIAALAESLNTNTNMRIRLETLAAAVRQFGNWSGRKQYPGNKATWKTTFGPTGEDALTELREAETEFGSHAKDILDKVKHHRRLLLGAVAGRFVLEGALKRAEAGNLEFHDLLVLARRLVATRSDIRAVLHAQYPRILLDEFQDTDPIQLEIAVRLAADPNDRAQEFSWRDLTPLPGRLFIVGDPKQSIYRFRRADIAQYLGAAEQVGADQTTLSANFRSTRAIIDFTNDVFARLITYEADAQPAFQHLDSCRRADHLDHGSVSVLGSEGHDDVQQRRKSESSMGAADTLRLLEATDVAAAVSTAIADKWAVVDKESNELRPCRAGDICILLPTRISLQAIESELRRIGLAYRAENSSVVYTTAEIRHLLLALRAADDPTDSLALVAALRSPLYGCSDVELWEWARGGSSWGLWATPPKGLEDHPVAEAISHVRSVAERIGWNSPADLLASIADERRLFDLALAGPDARDVWRRLRYVIEQARAWADAGGHGVRRYLAWAKLQASESRVADTILPEHDLDAVRIMTIHAAKGLEFPITIVAGMTTKPMRSQTTGVVWANNDWMLAGKGDDGVFIAHQPIDEQMGDAERRRMLYVACTRAVDHLVVSLHRGPPTKSNAEYSDWSPLTSAELLYAAGAAAESSGAHSPKFQSRQLPAKPSEPVQLKWPDHAEWATERALVLERASRRTGIAATRLSEEVQALAEREMTDDAGLDKRPVNVELPPWQRGRYGTSIGRAVHGVLQFCDLTSGDDIDTLARSQCAAEGVIGLETRVASLARSALLAPIVRSAAQGADHWRELFIAAPVGDRVLEGYVDLLVRTSGGLMIVDYKTDQWSGGTQVAERIGRYRVQLAAYGAALETTLGEPIVGGTLVRCIPDQSAEQIEIVDWQGALAEVRQIIQST